MKNALIRDFSPETREIGGTKISNIIKAVTLWVWLALTQGVHAESDNNIVTVDIDWNTFTQGVHAKSDKNIVTVDIDWNTFTYNLWNEDLLATCDKYMDKSKKLLEDCITWAETAMEAQEDLINANLNESKRELDSSERELASSERELASSKRELASSDARLKNAQARNEQTKKDMNVAKNQMNIAEKEANRVYKQERKKVLAN